MKPWRRGGAIVVVVLVALTATVLAQTASTTVYVTRTGEKYHRGTCRHLSRSQIPMPLAEAAKRFGPCSICKPPILPGSITRPLTESSAESTRRPAAAEAGRCQATTKKGTQCSRKASAGSRYCWQHG